MFPVVYVCWDGIFPGICVFVCAFWEGVFPGGYVGGCVYVCACWESVFPGRSVHMGRMYFQVCVCVCI